MWHRYGCARCCCGTAHLEILVAEGRPRHYQDERSGSSTVVSFRSMDLAIKDCMLTSAALGRRLRGRIASATAAPLVTSRPGAPNSQAAQAQTEEPTTRSERNCYSHGRNACVGTWACLLPDASRMISTPRRTHEQRQQRRAEACLGPRVLYRNRCPEPRRERQGG